MWGLSTKILHAITQLHRDMHSHFQGIDTRLDEIETTQSTLWRRIDILNERIQTIQQTVTGVVPPNNTGNSLQEPIPLLIEQARAALYDIQLAYIFLMRTCESDRAALKKSLHTSKTTLQAAQHSMESTEEHAEDMFNHLFPYGRRDTGPMRRIGDEEEMSETRA